MMRLRQICLVAEELMPVVDQLRRVFLLGEGYQDDGVGVFGLENRVIPIGYDFLEVVAPVTSGTSAGRYLDKRGGDGGYMVILQCADGLAARKRLAEQGVRRVLESDRAPDIWITQYHPSDCNGILLEIDSVNPELDYLEESCAWPPAGPAWLQQVRREETLALTGVALQDDNPRAFAALWSDLLDHPVHEVDGVPELHLANAAIRFVAPVDDRGTGLCGLEVKVVDMDAVRARAKEAGCPLEEGGFTLCGVHFTLVDEH